VQGSTRGDGEVGEDITFNLKTIRSLPLKIPININGPIPPANLVVRGEAFITIQDFLKLNKKLEEAGEGTYQNPRNTAAGSLRQLDPSLTARRPLSILVYEIVEENPMLGWRGASRYISEWYEKAFLLECKAIRKCREDGASRTSG
jgi:DNA ligase (NAD+)